MIWSSISDCTVAGYNFEGGDIGDFPAKNNRTCHAECFRNSTCNYWTFDTTTKKCHLKRELERAKKNTRYVSGPKLCLVTKDIEKEMKSMSCMENTNLDLHGADLEQGYNSRTKENCQFDCQTNPSCGFFTYVNGVSISLSTIL